MKRLLLAAIAFALLSQPLRARAGDVVFDENPSRPKDSGALLATSGTVLAYQLVATKDVTSRRLTIWDDVAHRRRTFVLGFDTKIDDRLFACGHATVRGFAFCEKLPANIVAGRTHVVLLYWKHEPGDPYADAIDSLPATDAIWTVAPAQTTH